VADIADYIKLIPPYHRNQPKFVAAMQLTLQPYVDLQNALADMPLKFDLDLAVGVQLDRIGERVGISRQIPVPIQNLFFSFGDELRGWGRGIWKGPYDSGSSLFALGDETYRRLLRAKIAANRWNGTVEQAEEIYRLFFNNPYSLIFVQDNCDGSQTVAISGAIPDSVSLSILSQELIPLKPQAIRTYYTVTTVGNRPVFGFGVNNDFIGGWGTGTWGRSPDYIIANGPASGTRFPPSVLLPYMINLRSLFSSSPTSAEGLGDGAFYVNGMMLERTANPTPAAIDTTELYQTLGRIWNYLPAFSTSLPKDSLCVYGRALAWVSNNIPRAPDPNFVTQLGALWDNLPTSPEGLGSKVFYRNGNALERTP
jgi:hypothetical protein